MCRVRLRPGSIRRLLPRGQHDSEASFVSHHPSVSFGSPESFRGQQNGFDHRTDLLQGQESVSSDGCQLIFQGCGIQNSKRNSFLTASQLVPGLPALRSLARANSRRSSTSSNVSRSCRSTVLASAICRSKSGRRAEAVLRFACAMLIDKCPFAARHYRPQSVCLPAPTIPGNCRRAGGTRFYCPLVSSGRDLITVARGAAESLLHGKCHMARPLRPH